MDSDEFVERPPAPALRRYVRRLQGYREYSARPRRRLQAPVGSCALILSFGERLRLYGPAGPTVARSFLAGMHDAAVRTEFHGHQAGMQVDLSPLGAFVLLRRPMAELTNEVPELDLLDDPELAALADRLAGDPGWAARFARLESFLGARLLAGAAREPDPEVAHAWQLLVHRSGDVGIEALAAETGWSRRHLLTRFRSQVGLAPKTAARVLRFERASRLVVARPDLAGVAADCGYSDQAHLTREFRALAGVTPTGYRRAFLQDAPVTAS
ncbi:AraC family transcriptional regulator [Pseudonocardia ailaonensis]|uniref:AraC family transcriptional regulator n=1 Tax=Pseudonocardia ailaonensis TaxID=367279 RepID=A0ABN2MSC5_9PSEU